MKVHSAILAVIGVPTFSAAALAGPAAVPGPVAGLGLPALALAASMYWALRWLLARKR